jgi:hypothetical protein
MYRRGQFGSVAVYLIRSLLVYVWCAVRNQTESAWFLTVHHTYTNKDLTKYAATLPNYVGAF